MKYTDNSCPTPYNYHVPNMAELFCTFIYPCTVFKAATKCLIVSLLSKNNPFKAPKKGEATKTQSNFFLSLKKISIFLLLHMYLRFALQIKHTKYKTESWCCLINDLCKKLFKSCFVEHLCKTYLLNSAVKNIIV